MCEIIIPSLKQFKEAMGENPKSIRKMVKDTHGKDIMTQESFENMMNSCNSFHDMNHLSKPIVSYSVF